MDLMNQVLELFVKFATIGGGLWLVWGAVTFGGGLKDHNGPQTQSGLWQIVGGGADLQCRGFGLSRLEASGSCMEDFIVAMLNMIGGGGAGSITGMLSQGPETWNPALYQLAVNVHDVAVKPLTSVVLAVVFTLELARNSTRIESDRELGVKIVAGTLFKVALVFLAVQNAGLFLRAFDSATQFLMQGASSQLSFDAAGDGGQLGDLMREQVEDAGMMGQAALFFPLAIPWLVSQLAAVVFTVVLYIRFIELYALTAFQSLPFALLVHEDTKPVGVGYFKAYARTSLNAVCVFVCLVFYQRIVIDTVRLPEDDGSGMVSWVTGNFGNLLMAGILLFFVIAVSQRVSRAIAGGE